ncbi:MAG TPA: universal stress protein [Cyanobacteria bacterium UBA11159]|nr:universal stress protein [Cyanobacteria bacterium UBA11366]HBK63610.1 universal stress protein [Cyanobacteria bacterium UBA11166]HBR73106.1 universal stress protein [Cyanobacteria bacterium UBA11159]HBS68016.1 universal stress protein [Cyanobacteria bacterium UBA11153]HCA93464.1 universal stress protein [Cyanobacteria bacterium UBA9226]
MIEKILLAVAGRGLCEQMFNMLMEIPIIQKASVTVLHVVPPQVTAEGMSDKLEEGGKILAEAVKSLKVDPSKITPRLKQGEPKDIVLQVGEEEKADLIIMGSRGLKRIESILENSVSQYVFQVSSRPMLLVKDDIYVRRITRIMVPMDKSASAKQSLTLALSFLRDIKNGQLYLVHINPEQKTPSGQTIINPEQDPVLAPAIAEAKKLGVSYRCLNATGKAGPEICRLAEESNIDLLILGSPDRRPSVAKALPDLDRLLGSSLSDYVRVYGNCPVLLTRTSD